MLNLRCKVVIVGDTAVGKSALTQMFHSGGQRFPKNYFMTIGVDFCVKVVNIPDTDTAVELYLFDTAGQETKTIRSSEAPLNDTVARTHTGPRQAPRPYPRFRKEPSVKSELKNNINR